MEKRNVQTVQKKRDEAKNELVLTMSGESLLAFFALLTSTHIHAVKVKRDVILLIFWHE